MCLREDRLHGFGQERTRPERRDANIDHRFFRRGLWLAHALRALLGQRGAATVTHSVTHGDRSAERSALPQTHPTSHDYRSPSRLPRLQNPPLTVLNALNATSSGAPVFGA